MGTDGRRQWGPQGRAAAPWWRAVTAAAVAYSETDTSRGADRVWGERRTALAAAIIRWAFALPLDAPVTLPNGPAGCGRWVTWWPVVDAANGYADAVAAEAVTVAALDAAVQRLSKAAMRWAVSGAVFRSPAAAGRIAHVTEADGVERSRELVAGGVA